MKIALLKKILIFLTIATMLFTLNSCTGVPEIDTGTVTLTVEENYVLGKISLTKNYYIYMDNIFMGMIINFEPLTLENIPIGLHTFKASTYSLVADSMNLSSNKYSPGDDKIEIEILPDNCYGSTSSYVYIGVNYVTISVFCGGAIL